MSDVQGAKRDFHSENEEEGYHTFPAMDNVQGDMTNDAEFSDKAEFQNDIHEAFNAVPGMKEMLKATGEQKAAAAYNRESKFQYGNEIITVSLKWNKATKGYEVTLHSSTDNKTRLVTSACGYIRASREYYNFCILTMEEVFTVKIHGSGLLDFKTE